MDPTEAESKKDATGEALAEQMDPEARAEAQKELDALAPGPAEPFRIGDQSQRTALDDDPISEGGSSRQERL